MQQPVEGRVDEMDVGAAPVVLRRAPGDDAGCLQHLEVMGQQVPGDVETGCQCVRGHVLIPEQVDDAQAKGIAEGVQYPCSPNPVGRGGDLIRIH